MQRIRIRAFSPFRSWLDGQPEVALEVEGPIQVGEMWARLARAYPSFAEFLPLGTDEALSRAILVAQGGRLLGPKDLVQLGVPVELLPSIAGGARRASPRSG